MDLSVIIVNYNVCKDVIRCLSSFKDTISEFNYEIIVVDNNSSNCDINEVKMLHPDAEILALKKNKGFGYANNEAMRIAKGRYLLLVNPDIIFVDKTAAELMQYLEDHPETGVISPVLKDPEGNIEYSDTFFPTFNSRLKQIFGGYNISKKAKKKIIDFFNSNLKKNLPFNVDNVMGACMMVRREIFESTGGFDDSFFLYEEETEWEYRIHKEGWEIKILPDVYVIHNHHSAIKKMGKNFEYYHFFRSRIIYSNKHCSYPELLLYTILFSAALLSRIIYNSLFYIFKRDDYYKKKFLLQYGLLKFNLQSRKEIITNKYDFNNHISSFPG